MELKCGNDEFVQLQSNEVNEDHSRKSKFGSCDFEMETFNGKVIEIKPVEDDNDMCNMQTSSDDVESDMRECHDHSTDTTGTEIESNMSKPVIIMPVVDSQMNSGETAAVAIQCVHNTGNDVKAIVPANIGNADLKLDVEEYKPKIASFSKSLENSGSVFKVIIIKKESNDIENEDAKNVEYTSKDADSVVGDSRDVQECKPSTDSASSLNSRGLENLSNFPNLTGVWVREETAMNVTNNTDDQVNVTVQANTNGAHVDLWDSEAVVNPRDCGESPWHCKMNPRDSEMIPWNSTVKPWDSDLNPWNSLKCVLCGKICETKSAISNHLRTHKLYQAYPCDECGMVYNKRSTLIKHKKQVHATKKQIHTCTLCGMELLGNHAFSVHLKAHESKNFRTYPCEYCDRVFTKERLMKWHRNNVHHVGEPKFTCETCGKKCKKQDNLDEHMELHRLEASSDEKQYICQVCGKECDSWMKLHQHQMVHRLPLICTSCQCGFRSLKRFIDHWGVHGILTQPSKSPTLVAMYSKASAKFTYVCTYCGEGFNESQKFIKHITEHPQSPVQRKSVHAAPSKLLNSAVVWSEMYSSLPYVCTSCGLGFGNPKLFKIHMRAHTVNPSSTKRVRRPFKLKSSDLQELTRDPFSEKYVLSPPSRLEN